jgi:hypothetical protein
LDAKRSYDKMASTTDGTTNDKNARMLQVDGKNYIPWAARTENKLKQEEVYAYVRDLNDGGIDVPGADGLPPSEAAIRRYEKGNAKALAEIMKYLPDLTITAMMEHKDSARDFWNALKTKMMLSGAYDRRIARTSLGELKHKYTDNVASTIMEAERLFAVFSSGNNPAPLPDAEKIGYLAAAITYAGGRWTTVADTIEALLDTAVPPTYATIKAKLEKEQRDKTGKLGAWSHEAPRFNFRMQGTGSGNKHSFNKAQGRAYEAAVKLGVDEEHARTIALSAVGGGGAGGGDRTQQKRYVPRGRCWNCGDNGHAKIDCPTTKPRCGLCDSNDHYYKECPKRDRESDRDARRGGGGSNDKASKATTRRRQDDDDDDDAASIMSYVSSKGLSAREASVLAEFIASRDVTEGKTARKYPIDSGCSQHMTPHADTFKTHRLKAPREHPGVKIANDDIISVTGVGDVKLNVKMNSRKNEELTLRNTLLVPELAESLTSVTGYSDEGYRVTFMENRGKCIISEPRNDERKVIPPGKIKATGSHDGQLWNLDVDASLNQKSMNGQLPDLWATASFAFRVTLLLAHERYGHLGVTRLKHMLIRQLNREYPDGGPTLTRKHKEIMRETLQFCEICELANARRQPFKKKGSGASRATEPNFRFYIDACIVNVRARTGAVCFIVIVDCKSRWGFYKGLKQRKDIYEVFVEFQTRVERQMEAPIKRIRTDNARETIAGRLGKHIRDEGIEFEFTSPGTSAMNNVAERCIQTIQSMIRASLTRANLDDTYWDDAGEEMMLLRNEQPSSALPNGESPYKNRFGIEPDLRMVRVWGCPAYTWIRDGTRESKVAARSVKGIYLGRSQEMRGWKVLIPETGVVIQSAHVKFDERFHTDHSQGRINRQAIGVNSLMFGKMENSLDVNAAAESDPRDTEIVGDSIGLSMSEMIDPNRVRLIRRPGDDNVEEFEENLEGHMNDNNRDIDTNQSSADIAPNDTVPPEVATINIEPRRSSRTPIPNQRYVENESGNAKLAWALRTKIGDVALAVRTLEKMGMSLPAIAMMAIKTTSEKKKTLMTSDVRPMIEAIADIAHVAPKSLIEIEGYEDGERKLWRAATQAEYDALMGNETWLLIPPKPGQKTVKCKWIWTPKTGANGELVKRKARLVALGFTQRLGVDYDETWAPTMNPVTMRVILGVATARGMKTHQADVPNAYLKSTLEHQVLMKQPEGFEVKGKEDWVCLLLKAIYGLKQAGLEWHRNIRKFFIDLGYKQCSMDNCAFVKKDNDGWLSVVGVHVDDTLIVTRNDEETDIIRKALMDRYKAEMGELNYYCGIKIERDLKSKRTFMSQEAYIDKMVEKYDSNSERSVRNPMCDVKLTKEMCPTTDEEVEKMKSIPYSNLVGALLFAAVMTRADISIAVHELSKFMKNPGMDHWKAAIRVLRYLKGTKRHGILFDGSGVTFTNKGDGTSRMNSAVHIYCDADYAGDLDDRRSTSGLLISMAGCTVYWRAKKQGGVTLSTMESEIVSMGIAVQYNEYIVALLGELGIEVESPSVIHEDNQSAIAYTKNAKNQSKARHLGVRFHYIRENVRDGKIRVEYCPTQEMLADIFTKRLPTDQFEYLRNGIGVVAVPDDMRIDSNLVANARIAITGEWECRDCRIENDIDIRMRQISDRARLTANCSKSGVVRKVNFGSGTTRKHSLLEADRG